MLFVLFRAVIGIFGTNFVITMLQLHRSHRDTYPSIARRFVAATCLSIIALREVPISALYVFPRSRRERFATPRRDPYDGFEVPGTIWLWAARQHARGVAYAHERGVVRMWVVGRLVSRERQNAAFAALCAGDVATARELAGVPPVQPRGRLA